MTHHPLFRRRLLRFVLECALFLSFLLALPATSQAASDPAQGPGGPILIVTSGSASYGTYYAEILRTEGLNAFAVADITSVTASTLSAYDVVLLATMPLSAGQVTLFTNWVNGGGNLIAMAPDVALAGLLGITPLSGSLSNAYMKVDTSSSPGNGIVDQTMQFHGSAMLYALNGATRLATLYSTASAATNSPALTLRNVGMGQAAAFTYDLARSIVYTRQGNPAWAAQERDGFSPIRSDDKFFGAASGDMQPDWVDLDKLAIPQADEQQRLLVNLILAMNENKKPLPRFWYLPYDKKAAILMTGDDHGNGGTAGRFDQFKALDPAGCSVADWECVRGTSYIYTSTPLSDAAAAQYVNDGFEIGLHVSTYCGDFNLASLRSTYQQQIPEFTVKYPSVGALRTERHHCIVWSDWSSGAQVQLENGIRLDTSYYHWPPGWIGNVIGTFTGSAMPMRYTKPDGSMLDVYMAATQMTDESGQAYPLTVDTLLDRALGPEGYYGVYTVNAHTDTASSAVSDAVVNSARSRKVSIISAKQLLTWIDARNASSFGSLVFGSGSLTFTISKNPAAVGLRAMLPVRSSGGRRLASLSRGGTQVNFTTSTVKGVEQAFFDAVGGSYVALYSVDTTAPTVVSKTPAAGATGVSVSTKVTATFSEAITPSTLNGSTFDLRNAAGALVSSAVSYDAATRTATITPSLALAGSSTYTATLHGGTTDPRVKDAAGNPLAANVSWTFKTAAAPTCPCSAWSPSTVPPTPQFDDPNAVELGVKFKSDLAGYITGIRFYKGTGNGGTHIGSLWSQSGGLLASATFVSETASGWQQVNFASPVAVSANTVYVASYFAPQGHYAASGSYFASSGVDNAPIHLLKDGVSGGNGVYRYTGASSFPDSTFNATNYWVDVVFATSAIARTQQQARATSSACSAPANRIVAENCLTGNPANEWDIAGSGDGSIQGFATDISVNKGSTVSFKVDTDASNYRFDIYRMGYYGGAGARKVATVTPSASLPQTQPNCLEDSATGLIDCGNWRVSGSWTVPSTATSGIYFAKLVRGDSGGASHIFFVVRDDASSSALLFQTSDTTWQAYNDYGGNSLYTGSPAGRAYKVSYNRPFQTRSVDGGQDWVFNAEYPMVRWLEANGYDLSYFTGVDSERRGNVIRNHKVFLSVGHDEYWSGGQRANVTAARDAGVHLAFFSGNEVFWKTRWEPSIDASATAYRTLVTYKETHANAKIDPTPTWTGSWRDPRFSPPADGGRPENQLTGTLFMVNDGATTSITVPSADGKMRFWRNTSVATLGSTSSATLPFGTLGYEWDVDADNGVRPPGLFHLSTTTVPNAPVLQDYGSTYGSGTATHSMTLYRHSSGARVFGAGTVQWPWGLDDVHDRGGTPIDARMRQATVNLLADMNVQPGSLQSGLVAASASSDTVAPSSTIASPASGSTVSPGASVSISGTASDAGGVVGGVEVSADSGATWHPATGRSNWAFAWTPPAAGSFNIKSRAVDDSGNLETPKPGITVTVGAQTCPCSLFAASAVPGFVSDPDTAAVNLGVKFTSERSGFITGIRFYKGNTNTGTHVGSLWSSTGTLLASATFTGETASGWQQVNFATPVAVSANTVYVASYLAPNGHYAADEGFFASTAVNNPPLHAAANGNGVYMYASSTAFPSLTFNATNYWVDVVFRT